MKYNSEQQIVVESENRKQEETVKLKAVEFINCNLWDIRMDKILFSGILR